MAHYNSFIRIPALVIRNRIAPLPRLDAFKADVVHMRVWPNDIDFNFHLNNARYLSVMDYGRVRLLARAGLLTPALKAHWVPLVGGVWITYRRSLALWARYALSTRLDCWDERWFYMEQTFTGKDGLAAVGWVKGALYDPANKSIVEPQRILDMAQPGLVSPPVPESIQILNELTREKLQNAS
jgi:acyl-CoA thioesterase FadM